MHTTTKLLIKTQPARQDSAITTADLYKLVCNERYSIVDVTATNLVATYQKLAKLAPELELKRLDKRLFELTLPPFTV